MFVTIWYTYFVSDDLKTTASMARGWLLVHDKNGSPEKGTSLANYVPYLWFLKVADQVT